LGEVTPEGPISYRQNYAERGGNLVYVLDKIAGRDLIANKGALKKKKIALVDMTKIDGEKK
jgi:hypothetical protein